MAGMQNSSSSSSSAPLRPQGALAATLATHAVRMGARAVQVGARRDGLPTQTKPCGERGAHILHILRRWRREGGAVAERHQRRMCFWQM
eukprot:4463041-Prymnesium_polylepis.1